MSSPVVSNHIWKEMEKIFNLPEHCIECDIHLGLNEAVTITTTCFATRSSGRTVTKRYYLSEIPTPVKERTRIN